MTLLTVCRDWAFRERASFPVYPYFVLNQAKLSSASLWIWLEEELGRNFISSLENQPLFGIYSPLKLSSAWDHDEKGMNKGRHASWSLLPFLLHTGPWSQSPGYTGLGWSISFISQKHQTQPLDDTRAIAVYPLLRTGNSWRPQISLLVNADLLMVNKNPVQSPLKSVEKVSSDFSDLWMSLWHAGAVTPTTLFVGKRRETEAHWQEHAASLAAAGCKDLLTC